MQDNLETTRLLMKPLKEDDFDKVYQLQSNPDVMRYIGSGKPRTKEHIQRLFQLLLDHQKKHRFTLCPTYEKKSGAFIGFSGLIHLALDDSNPDIEVGYWLLPEFWGKGYATEAVKAWSQWAFDHLSIDVLVGVTQPKHIDSQRVLEKSGFCNRGISQYRDQEIFRFELKKSN